MLKKTLTYKDFNDVEHTEDFYFHLNEVELIDLEVSTKEGFGETLKRIAEEQDPKELVDFFKRFILMSYGQKSEDGKLFVKSDAIREAFTQSAAYPRLYMELATNAKVAGHFMTHIIPADLLAQISMEDHKEKAKK